MQKKRTVLLITTFFLLMLLLVSCTKTERTLTAADYLDLGEKYLLELDYDQALVQFLKVIEIDSMNPRGYTGAAEAYVGLGRTDDAVGVLRSGLISLPGNKELQAMIDALLPLEPDKATEAEPEPEQAAEPIITEETEPLPDSIATIIEAVKNALQERDPQSAFDLLYSQELVDYIGEFYSDNNGFSCSLSGHGGISYFNATKDQSGNWLDGTEYNANRGMIMNDFDGVGMAFRYTDIANGKYTGAHELVIWYPDGSVERHSLGTMKDGVFSGTEIIYNRYSDGTLDRVWEYEYFNGKDNTEGRAYDIFSGRSGPNDT